MASALGWFGNNLTPFGWTYRLVKGHKMSNETYESVLAGSVSLVGGLVGGPLGALLAGGTSGVIEGTVLRDEQISSDQKDQVGTLLSWLPH